RGDYYDLSGNLQSTVIGEGPIDAINNVYNNQAVGSWNGYGYFSLFEERLSGQIQLSTTPTTESQLGNISTRGFVQTGDNVIVPGKNIPARLALVQVYDLGPNTASILGNISTRGLVQTDDYVMIGGFIVTGTGSKKMIMCAIAPAAARHGVPNALADPTLELH